MATANLTDLWNRAVENCRRHRREEESAASRALALQESTLRRNALTLFRNAARQHLGTIGPSLVDKEFDRLKLNGGRLDDAHLTDFYDHLASQARLVAGTSRTEQMLTEMKKGARGLLKQR
jgi:hypothetical protein